MTKHVMEFTPDMLAQFIIDAINEGRPNLARDYSIVYARLVRRITK